MESCASGIPVLLPTSGRLAGGDSADYWLSDPLTGTGNPAEAVALAEILLMNPADHASKFGNGVFGHLPTTADVKRALTKILLKNHGPGPSLHVASQIQRFMQTSQDLDTNRIKITPPSSAAVWHVAGPVMLFL
ncbi:hypothetical protein IFM61606_04223 [Aspergillus udagawae]|uniref:Uncharacterized protein n=1 Tax=Aspergillus udagawae TaxID=91492 RepID=A0ABQ1A7M0_9EURO|nr:hypothetical protein IFM51744_01956 [Aspergillus udagawae]GFF75505.1 hypothetical protein IFM53868_01597 [Aspergillus udagawae]GFG01679.1 hypothetical protein IFM5058_00557 [Aspergillus udagawae]GFG24318.1 hypothetical protein IFM61606_04223 [Aspergillus udagawae]